MGCVAVRTHQGIGEGDAVFYLYDRRHALQIDLMHDAIARRDNLDILKGPFCPLDEVETIFIASILNGSVLGEGVLVIAIELDSQGVIDDQLCLHHGVDLGRVAASVGYGIAQARQIDERRLT